MARGPKPVFTQRRQVFLEPATDDVIRALAEQYELSMSQVIREAVDHYVQKRQEDSDGAKQRAS